MNPTLANLATELRLHIFKSLVRSLPFYFPRPDPRNTPNTLSFLSTCRLFHSEASPLILPNATIHCRATEHVVDFLSSLSREQISSIRHLSFRGTPFPLYLNSGFYTTHDCFTALKLFPGLQLDTLMVRDAYHGPGVCEDGWGHIATYFEIEHMVTKGKGYKELRYMSANPEFLLWTPFQEGDADRLPQPMAWDSMIKERDGLDSGACVEMYITRPEAAGVEGAALDDTFPERSFDQATLLHERREGEHGDCETVPEREVLVIVKRGDHCDYAENGSDLPGGIKDLFEAKSWKQIKEEGIILQAEDDPTAHL